MIRENVADYRDIRRRDINDCVSIRMGRPVVHQCELLRALTQCHAARISDCWERLRRIMPIAQANERDILHRREPFLYVLLPYNRYSFGAEEHVPASMIKVPMVFTRRVTGRIVALKIASLSSVTRVSIPLSISKVLPLSTIAVTSPPSPESMNNP